MHLARDPDGADAGTRMLRQQLPNRRAARGPPCLGILFRPSRLGRLERQRLGNDSIDLAACPHQDRFDTAGPDVETEKQISRHAHRTPSSNSIVS